MFRRLTPNQLTADIVIAVAAVLLRLSLGFDALTMALVIFGMGSALALRRVSPGLALAVAWLFAIVQMVTLQSPDASNIAILAVLYCTSRYGSAPVKWAGLISAIVGAVVATGYWMAAPFASLAFGSFVSAMGPSELAQLAVTTTVGLTSALAVLGLSWTLGLLAKTWATARESRQAKAAADQVVIVEQERNRIARDMHDVVAHSLAVVIAQADGGRYADDPATKDQALTTISATAREALADVRLLLGQLRHSQDAGPQPALADLDRLVEQMRASGLLVELRVAGEPLALPASQQLAVYRIVQEALTNALRHGDAAEPVHLQIEWSRDAATLDIASALRTPVPASAPPGHGLAGMRERALLVGGTLTAAPDGDRFVVRAVIPVPVSVTA